MYKLKIFAVIFAILLLNLRFFNTKQVANAVNSNEIQAESMVTIEALTGRILYSKDENKRLPMASTTKIITAIVAIENCKDLDKKHLITKEMTGVEGSSIYLRAGEHLTLRELLYGLMLRSGNDSAVAIAIIVGGSVDNFIKMMNDFCIAHGMMNTHIVTVNGLHDDNHYTTALDLAKITAYAMNNPIFYEIVGTKEIKIDNELDQKNKCRFLKNKNKLLTNLSGADGVKTGYTRKAGKCFVGSATRNGMRVICVVLNSRTMFDDSMKFIERTFEEYQLVKLFSRGEINNYDENLKTQNIKLIIKNDIFYPLKQEELLKINARLNINNNEVENNVSATLDFKIQNDLLFSEKIYTIDVEKEEKVSVLDNLKKIISAF